MAPYFLTNLRKKKRKINMASRPKRSRLECDPDRLSDLPDSLIVRIFSLLEMKDVVKTSVLSKRWKLLWTHVYNIVYDFHLVEEDGWGKLTYLKPRTESEKKEMERYIAFIDSSLMQCVSNIKEFSLSGIAKDNYSYPKSQINRWIEFVIEKKVQIMKLDWDVIYLGTPKSLFRCSSLTELTLRNVGLYLSAPVNWPFLKILTLKEAELDEDLINILLGSPLLETLVLIESVGLNHLCITSASLKKLIIEDIKYADCSVSQILEIRTPLLRELEISSSFMVRKCLLLDVSSLIVATLDFTIYAPPFNADGVETEEDMAIEFNHEWARMVAEILKSVCHVDKLFIGSELLQVLSASSLLGKPSPTFMCKHVTIISPLWKYGLFGIVCLLEGTPHLETLVVEVSEYDFPLELIVEVFNDIHPQLNFANGNFMHLKSVKVDYRQNPCPDCNDNPGTWRKCRDFELFCYILRSCVALERLVFCSSKAYSRKTPECLNPYCAFPYVHNLSSKLLTDSLPANEDTEWELKKRKFDLEYTFSNYASMR